MGREVHASRQAREAAFMDRQLLSQAAAVRYAAERGQVLVGDWEHVLHVGRDDVGQVEQRFRHPGELEYTNKACE